jgi:hypothetical protein
MPIFVENVTILPGTDDNEAKKLLIESRNASQDPSPKLCGKCDSSTWYLKSPNHASSGLKRRFLWKM